MNIHSSKLVEKVVALSSVKSVTCYYSTRNTPSETSIDAISAINNDDQDKIE